ncbi:MAG: phosphatase PAP2 family protein [Rhodothermales bacterium]
MGVPSTLRAWLRRIDDLDIRIVRAVVLSAHRPFQKRATELICRLGNGWLYLIMGLSAWIVKGDAAHRMIGWSALAGTLAFPVYWIVKRWSARARPHHRDPSLNTGLRTLDLYSFPSGHAMTATAVGLPYGLTLPHAFIPFVVGWLLIAWSRLASGHHYPSDIIAGALIGVGTAITAMALLP